MSVFIETNSESLFKHGEVACAEIRWRSFLARAMLRRSFWPTGSGSGVKANILSTLTSKIAATMLSEGADI